MSTTFTPRPANELVELARDDRRRLVISELRMLAEDGLAPSPLTFGQVILKHSLADSETDVVKLADAVQHKLYFG